MSTIKEQWAKLLEPVAFFTVLAAGAAALGAFDMPSWVSIAAAVMVAVAGAAVRSIVTPVADPRDNDGNQLIADK